MVLSNRAIETPKVECVTNAASPDLVDQASGYANGLAIKFGALMGR